MTLGIIGLGRMGGNIARRLLRGDLSVAGYDADPTAAAILASEGLGLAADLDDLVGRLAPPRAVWCMLPAGRVTDDAVSRLADLLARGDVVIDGGNGHYRDDIRRAAALTERGIRYLDVGVSGGIWGLDRGYCLMIGGDGESVAALAPVFRALSPGRDTVPASARRADGTEAEGWLHCGPVGAGHYVKMVHNAIEYGMMQALAEGFALLREGPSHHVPEVERFPLDAAAIAELWRRGSVVSSWLLDLTAASLAEDPTLSGYQGRVADSGEGRWALETAIARDVPAMVLAASLFARFRSRQDAPFAERILSAMRQGFGGHAEVRGG
jgi:6-phosphogluconate dehydrogenase